MKKYISIVVAILIIGVAIGVTKNNDTGEQGPIKIGVSLPVTGEVASYGETGVIGIELAVQEINNQGGVNGRELQVIIEDDQCSAEGVSAVNKLVNLDKVDMLVGPLCSSVAGPALPMVKDSGVPTIIWASAPHLTGIGENIFRAYPSDAAQGKFMAEYLFEVKGHKKVAVLFVKNDWGQGLHDVFTKRFVELGGEVVFSEGSPQNNTDLKTPLAKIKATDADAVYIPLYPSGGGAAITQMKSLGMDLPVYGSDSFNTTEITDIPEAEGVIFVLGKFDNPEDFQSYTLESTGKESSLMTPFAYDSIKVAAQVLGEAGTDKASVIKALSEIVYEESVTFPAVEFDEIGDLASFDFEIRVISNGEAVTLE